MPRMSAKVKFHRPVSKKSCITPMATYYAIEEAKDVLFGIKGCNKSWGKEWYNYIEAELYESALKIVEQKGKGDSLEIAINTIREIIELTEHLNDLEKENN